MRELLEIALILVSFIVGFLALRTVFMKGYKKKGKEDSFEYVVLFIVGAFMIGFSMEYLALVDQQIYDDTKFSTLRQRLFWICVIGCFMAFMRFLVFVKNDSKEGN